jgi:hypothetical protein
VDPHAVQFPQQAGQAAPLRVACECKVIMRVCSCSQGLDGVGVCCLGGGSSSNIGVGSVIDAAFICLSSHFFHAPIQVPAMSSSFGKP